MGRDRARWLASVSVAAALLAPAAALPEEVEPRRLTLEARPAPGSPPAQAWTPAGTDYRIGRQDLLEIKVFDVAELNQTVRVAEDGSITMPLLGRLAAAGRTRAELETTIADLLEERYVRDPQVTIFVREHESRRIAVTGAVRNPGAYEMLGRKTVLELLSMAGGLDQDFGKEIVVFRRDGEGVSRRITIDVERLVYAADPGLNLDVEPGDIIYVPAVERVRIFVSGAVRNPDLYEIPREEPVTVLEAITLAGGTTDRAAEKRVQVIRTDEQGRRVAFEVDLKRIKRGKAEDPILERDDVVLVPESFF
jgi:polysaccharide export outer membrane protein